MAPVSIVEGPVKIPAGLTDLTTILLQATETPWVSPRKLKMFVRVSLILP